MSDIITIRYRWDDNDPDNEGWYAEALDKDGVVVADSTKVWFPVDVDRFWEWEEDQMVAALRAAFRFTEVEPW